MRIKFKGDLNALTDHALHVGDSVELTISGVVSCVSTDIIDVSGIGGSDYAMGDRTVEITVTRTGL